MNDSHYNIWGHIWKSEKSYPLLEELRAFTKEIVPNYELLEKNMKDDHYSINEDDVLTEIYGVECLQRDISDYVLSEF
jgi:hypothetical protein